MKFENNCVKDIKIAYVGGGSRGWAWGLMSDLASAGDISGDGEVDLKDVTVLRRYLAGGYGVTVQEAALDINRDGAIDLKDVTYLRRALAGGYGITLE